MTVKDVIESLKLVCKERDRPNDWDGRIAADIMGAIRGPDIREPYPKLTKWLSTHSKDFRPSYKTADEYLKWRFTAKIRALIFPHNSYPGEVNYYAIMKSDKVFLEKLIKWLELEHSFECGTAARHTLASYIHYAKHLRDALQWLPHKTHK